MTQLRLIATLTFLALAPTAQAQTAQIPAQVPAGADISAAMKLAAVEQSEKEDSIERERHDLAAQESMARSANSLLEPSWWQVWIGGFGLLGLLTSLTFNALSLRQTRAALASQRETAHAQMRAYVGVESAVVTSLAVGAKPTVKVDVQNYGNTPAYHLAIASAVKFLPKGAEPSFSVGVPDPGIAINPGGTTVATEKGPELTQEMFDQFVTGELKDSAAITCVMEITYTTLSEAKVLQIAVVFWGAGLGQHQVLTAFNRCD